MLLDSNGTKECGNAGEQVCPRGREPDTSAWNCMGRLMHGHPQLMPSSNSKAHKWVHLAHSFGVVVHAWTIRNEVRSITPVVDDLPGVLCRAGAWCMPVRATCSEAAVHVEQHACQTIRRLRVM